MDFTMVQGEERFQYERLEPGHIRLFTVFPAGPSSIGCRFHHVPLNDLPVSYTAISYVWGDPAVVSKAYCGGGQVLGLTASVHFLLSLMVETQGAVFFWIDLLCINQADNAEKSRQIRLMGDIFGSADRVAGWLGKPSVDSRQGLLFIITFINALIDRPNIARNRPSLALEELCWSFPLSNWKALSNLLARPWFQRIWVVQEAVRARHLTIFCEHPSIAVNWDHLSLLINILRVTDSTAQLRVTPPDSSTPTFLPHGVLNTTTKSGLRSAREGGSQLALQTALVDCRRFKSTDPRDIIYGVLGLVTDAGNEALDPDYEASVETVFTRTTQFLLTRNNSLQILHIAGIGWPRNLTDMPSWVPDWTLSQHLTVFGRVEEYGPKYNATGTSSIAVRAANYPDTILSKSVVLDHIIKISRALREGSFDHGKEAVQSNGADMMSWLQEACAIADSSLAVQENGTASDHLWRTLIANHERGRPAPADFEGALPHFIRAHAHMAAFGTTSGLDNDTILGSNRFTNALSAALHAGVNGHLLFRTATGFLGLCPPKTSLGDKICVILGATTPFLIRERDPVEKSAEMCYSLVGECYVQGLMNGEGLQMGEVQETCLV